MRTVRGSQQTVTEFEIAPGASNRVRINRAAPVRAREALGITRTVLFSPEDLQLVKGEPAGRRRFIDDLAVSLRPVVAGYRQEYERILRQRNSLLKHCSAAVPWRQTMKTRCTPLMCGRNNWLS